MLTYRCSPSPRENCIPSETPCLLCSRRRLLTSRVGRATAIPPSPSSPLPCFHERSNRPARATTVEECKVSQGPVLRRAAPCHASIPCAHTLMECGARKAENAVVFSAGVHGLAENVGAAPAGDDPENGELSSVPLLLRSLECSLPWSALRCVMSLLRGLKRSKGYRIWSVAPPAFAAERRLLRSPWRCFFFALRGWSCRPVCQDCVEDLRRRALPISLQRACTRGLWFLCTLRRKPGRVLW